MKSEVLKHKIASHELLILIDVREPDEVEADPYFIAPPICYLNVPMMPLLYASQSELETKIFTSLGLPVTTLIITLCRSGGRSARACAHLRQFGWRAENLEGGIVAWGPPIRL